MNTPQNYFLSRFVGFVSIGMAFTSIVTASDASTVSFEDSADISSHFNSTGAAKFSVLPSGGLSGSGSAVLDDSFTNGTLTSLTTFTTGASNPIFSLSVYFRFGTPTSDAGGDALVLGIDPSASVTPFTGFTSQKLSLRKSAFSTGYVLISQFGSNSTSSSNITLQDGNWYRLGIDAIWNSSGATYNLRYRLNMSDNTGSSAPPYTVRSRHSGERQLTHSIFSSPQVGQPDPWASRHLIT